MLRSARTGSIDAACGHCQFSIPARAGQWTLTRLSADVAAICRRVIRHRVSVVSARNELVRLPPYCVGQSATVRLHPLADQEFPDGRP